MEMLVLVMLTIAFSVTPGAAYSPHVTKDGMPLVINGPRSLSDRIAIVGAGVSGINMATMLKSRGFENIVIYERNNRIGGKSMSIRDDEGTVQELGSCCTGPGYEDNIMEIINEYAPGELIPRPLGDVWLDGADNATSYGNFVVQQAMDHFQTTNIEEAMMKLAEQIKNYINIHKSLFPDYEFELMPRPSKDVLQKLRCTYLQFLKSHKLEGLLPLLIVSHTLQGYRYLDEVSAVYGLMWNTPFLMKSFIDMMKGGAAPRTYMLRIGFQHLWERVAHENNLNVKLNTKIKAIYRNEDSVRVCDHADHCYTHDFLIWSGEAKRSLDVIDTPHWKEVKLFSALSPDYMVSSLVHLKGGKSSKTGTGYWLDNVINKRSMSVWASRDTKKVFELGGVPSTAQNSVDKYRFELAYQYSPTRPCKPKRKALLHFYETGAIMPEITRQNVWRYFPHYSVDKAADGYLWDILEMQGHSKTWFIGSSVSFESLKSVVEYNKLLLSLMRPVGH